MRKEKYYVHSSKEANWEYAEDWGLAEDEGFMEYFRWTAMEIEFDVEINDHGKVYATAVNGVKLEKPVRL